MITSGLNSEREFWADERLEELVTVIAARSFPSPSSGNTYIGFRLRCGRLKRELLAYLSLYRARNGCYPNHDLLMAVGDCISPLFEQRRDWKSLASQSWETLVVDELCFGQISLMANLHLPLQSTLEEFWTWLTHRTDK